MNKCEKIFHVLMEAVKSETTKVIKEEVEDYNFSDEQKQVVLDVMKTLLDDKEFNDWKEYIDQICYEMYKNHGYMKYQIQHLDQKGLKAILNDVDSGWLQEQEDYVPEYEESVKTNKSRKIIKEQMEPGYWEKVEQYQKDIKEYLNRGDGEEYQGFDGYVDTDDFYTTVGEILKQNPDKVKALDDELVSYVEGVPGGDSGDSIDGSLGLWCDVVEGNEGYSHFPFYGLKDPELYTDLGFNVPEELMILLKARFVDIARGNSDWDGDDGWADDRAEGELEDMGLTGVVKAINDIHAEYDQDDQDQDDIEQESIEDNTQDTIINRIKQVIASNNMQDDYKAPITDECINKISEVPELKESILKGEDDLSVADAIVYALEKACNLTMKTEDDRYEEIMKKENQYKRVHKDITFNQDSDCYDAVRNIFKDCLQFDVENSEQDLSDVDVQGLTQDYFEDCLEDAEVKEALQAYVADTDGETDAYDNLENAINYWIMDNVVTELENKASFGDDWQW